MLWSKLACRFLTHVLQESHLLPPASEEEGAPGPRYTQHPSESCPAQAPSCRSFLEMCMDDDFTPPHGARTEHPAAQHIEPWAARTRPRFLSPPRTHRFGHQDTNSELQHHPRPNDAPSPPRPQRHECMEARRTCGWFAVEKQLAMDEAKGRIAAPSPASEANRRRRASSPTSPPLYRQANDSRTRIRLARAFNTSCMVRLVRSAQDRRCIQ